MIDLEAIEARERKATKGPWESISSSLDGTRQCMVLVPVKNEDGLRYAVASATDELKPTAGFYSAFDEQSPGEAHANMDFIAHAREDIPALIAEVRRLREALREIACFDDHPELDELMGLGHLDEPGAASIAREALKEKK